VNILGALDRAERFAVGIWIALALVFGNAIYDLLVTRGIKEYLFRYALAEAGRGPTVRLSDTMDGIVRDATWMALLSGSIILLAGMLTVWVMKSHSQKLKPEDRASASRSL
jgi:hypothetical protein